VVAPGLAATGILTFVFSWNEFAVALNLTTKPTATVPVAIAKFAQDFEIQYTQMAASAALSILPALVLLLIGQRYIVKGLTQGAVK
jgi:multiple sugar transport system permease protein